MRQSIDTDQRRRSTAVRDTSGRQVVVQLTEPISNNLRVTHQRRNSADNYSDFAGADSQELAMKSTCASEQATKHVLVAITNPLRRTSNVSF